MWYCNFILLCVKVIDTKEKDFKKNKENMSGMEDICF